MAEALAALRDEGGRLFLLGVGGSAANCSHAVNDFRKLCGIEAYSPTDNVSELTARTNDEGLGPPSSPSGSKSSRASSRDMVFIFSVGGGDMEKNVSPNLVAAIEEARVRGMKITGVVGRAGGHAKQVGDIVVVVPTVHEDRVTPHTEAFQAVVLHCLVSNPKLQIRGTKW